MTTPVPALRDCAHGRQAGKCADCEVLELQAQVAALESELDQIPREWRALALRLKAGQAEVATAPVAPLPEQNGPAKRAAKFIFFATFLTLAVGYLVTLLRMDLQALVP